MKLYLVIFLAVFWGGQCQRRRWKNVKYGDQVPWEDLVTDNYSVRRKILSYHNHYRSKVNPPASNMLQMKWNTKAAATAKYWAMQCQYLRHDPPEQRYLEMFGNCGQNIFVSSHKMTWKFAVKEWYIEFRNFTYGSPYNNLKEVGHYTQLVWATSHRMGCHIHRCPYGGPGGRPFFNYVCNYCPTGNWKDKLETPYKIGPPCKHCPKACVKKRLCNNACPYQDKWSNCKELMTYGRKWLCGNQTEDSLQRSNFCKATCECVLRIHEWQ